MFAALTRHPRPSGDNQWHPSSSSSRPPTHDPRSSNGSSSSNNKNSIGSSSSRRRGRRDDSATMIPADGGVPPVPQHPVPQMQGAFEESMKETLDEPTNNAKNPYYNADKIQRRKLLLESPRYERTVGGRWVQRRGENFHPLWKLVAQITFGMHLLQSGMAKSDEEVIRILQSHVDEVDGFLERTTEDFELAQHDILERIKYLRLPLEHGDVFDKMLGDRDFRAAIVDGNDKIEHIVARTTTAMKDALKDVQKGLDGTRELYRFLTELDRRWRDKSPDHDAVFAAMMGNAEGWNGAFKSIQKQGSELGHSLVQLGGVITGIQKRVGIASRRNLPSNKTSNPVSATSSKTSSKRESVRPPQHDYLQMSNENPQPQSQPSSSRPSNRTSVLQQPLLPAPAAAAAAAPQTKSLVTNTRSPAPMMSPIHEQYPPRSMQDQRKIEKGLMQTAMVMQQPITPTTQASHGQAPVELPAESKPNPRVSIHALMTMEALSGIPSAAASQRSGQLPTTVEDEDEDGPVPRRSEEAPEVNELEGDTKGWDDKEVDLRAATPEDSDARVKGARTPTPRLELSYTSDPFEDPFRDAAFSRPHGGPSQEVASTHPREDIPKEILTRGTHDETRPQAGTAEPTQGIPSGGAPAGSQAKNPFEDEAAEAEAEGLTIEQLHDEILTSLSSSEAQRAEPETDTPNAETVSQFSGTNEMKKSPQMEGGTFFGYASSDADTGSIDARSTPGMGRSRSASSSQPQMSHLPKTLAEQNSSSYPAGEEEDGGQVNRKHPIFQDIRSRDILHIETGQDAIGPGTSGLAVRSAGESPSSGARKNSFMTSNSGAPAHKSQSGSPTGVEQSESSNRASENTATTPASLRGTSSEPGLRVRSGSSRPGSRPRTQAGQAPPIAPAPIQTQGLPTSTGGADGDHPPSPDLRDLTSATVSGPDMGDPFAPYTTKKSKHPELLERINGALQESANREASASPSSPNRHARTLSSKNHKKSMSELQQQQQQQLLQQPQQQLQPQQQVPAPPQPTYTFTGPTNTTTTTTTLDASGHHQYSASVSNGENTYLQTTTTTSSSGPEMTVTNASSHGRSRTLSPFSASGLLGRKSPDRSPEVDRGEAQFGGNGGSMGKKGFKKFFSMKKGKKGASENF